MATLQEILARAQALREETELGSISPERAGSIMYDTLQQINQMQLLGASLVINKIYASVAAMEADSAPVSDLSGTALKEGQLAVIVPSDTSSSDLGSVYRYNGTTDGVSSWSFVGKIGGYPMDETPTEGSTRAVTSGGVYSKVSQLAQIVGQISEGTTVISPNLFDKTARTEEKYVNKTTGALATSTNWDVSDYIDVSSLAPGTSMCVSMASSYSGSIGVAYYNSSKVFTHGGAKTTQTQSGDAYVRISVHKSDIDTAMFIVGTSADVPGEYMPYGPIYSYEAIVPEDSVDTDNIKDSAVTGDKLAAGAAAEGLITSTEKDISFNMIDFGSLVGGTYINSSGGVSTTSTTTYRASNYIPLNGKKVYWGVGMGGYGASTNGAAVYDADMNVIRVFKPLTTGDYDTVSAAEGAAYIRLTLTGSYTLYYVCYADADGNNPMAVNAGDVTADVNYFREQIIQHSAPGVVFGKETMPELLPAFSMAGQGGFGKTFASIAANSSGDIAATEFPGYIKSVYTISTKAFLTGLTGSDYVRIGVNKDSANGKFIKVTEDSVLIQRYDNNDNTYATNLSFLHGLTISDFFMLEVNFTWDGGSLRLISRDGSFAQTWENSQYSYTGNAQVNYGRAFIDTTVALTNVKLSQCSDRFRKPVWVIGDSYVSMNSKRWPYYFINLFGIKDFLLAGYAGAPSETMEPQLDLMLQFGTPKFLVWALGMNDAVSVWMNWAKKVEMLCRDKGITLIYTTIPKSNDNKDEINLYIRNSGYRYIDFVDAVMVNGAWYPDMDDDGTHPTALGAQVLAGQVLVDFPEIASLP